MNFSYHTQPINNGTVRITGTAKIRDESGKMRGKDYTLTHGTVYFLGETPIQIISKDISTNINGTYGTFTYTYTDDEGVKSVDLGLTANAAAQKLYDLGATKYAGAKRGGRKRQSRRQTRRQSRRRSRRSRSRRV